MKVGNKRNGKMSKYAFDIDLKVSDLSGYKPKPLEYGSKKCSESCSGCCSGTCSTSNCCS